jgi:hypothetical protein
MKTQQDVSRPGKVITREQLYEAVWSKQMVTLISEWNTNYEQLRQACDKLQVPRPGMRYWAAIKYGRPAKKKRLRPPGKTAPPSWVLLTREEGAAKNERELEALRRERLVGSAEAWLEARRLRRFIRACEAVLKREGGSLPAGGWQQTWLTWAQEHADRLDPMTNGFLEREHERLTVPDDSKDEPEPTERTIGDIMRENLF